MQKGRIEHLYQTLHSLSLKLRPHFGDVADSEHMTSRLFRLEAMETAQETLRRALRVGHQHEGGAV